MDGAGRRLPKRTAIPLLRRADLILPLHPARRPKTTPVRQRPSRISRSAPHRWCLISLITPRSARNAPQISIESREDDPFIPIDGQYATGLVIPDHVKEYWKTHTPTRKYRSRRNLPTALDWSTYDSPVRNQGSCGSCWAFAATALIENLVNQANLSVENNFAEQVLVSCLYGMMAAMGAGTGPLSTMIHQEGIPPESCYPYSGPAMGPATGNVRRRTSQGQNFIIYARKRYCGGKRVLMWMT